MHVLYVCVYVRAFCMSTRICGLVDISIYLVVYGSNGVSERLDA